MHKLSSKSGMTMAEILVMAILFSVVLTAGSMVFMAGQNAFSVAAVRAELQENVRRAVQRISFELEQSGKDNTGTFKVSVLDGTGVNATDILRFSIPLCICGTRAMDSNGNVSHWGAPLQWGQLGCSTNYTVNNNGKVDICHFPPGNPNNSQSLSVSVNAVKAHLAHGDYIGSCNNCDPNSYTNRTVEYSIDNSGRLLRKVLDSNGAVVNSVVVAQKLTDFQTTLNTGQMKVTVTIQLTGKATQNRTISISNSIDVILRNRG